MQQKCRAIENMCKYIILWVIIPQKSEQSDHGK